MAQWALTPTSAILFCHPSTPITREEYEAFKME